MEATQKKIDFKLVAVITLSIICTVLLFKSCTTPKSELVDIASKEEIEANNEQKRYDSMTIYVNHYLDSLNAIVVRTKKNTSQIIVKYKTIHDTIMVTPESEQLEITKELCPGTGDTINLKEINYCLADGKKAEDLYKNSLLEIDALESEIELHVELVKEGIKNMESKDLLIDSLEENNLKLTGKLKKETHRKIIWRNVSIGVLTIVGLIISL